MARRRKKRRLRPRRLLFLIVVFALLVYGVVAAGQFLFDGETVPVQAPPVEVEPVSLPDEEIEEEVPLRSERAFLLRRADGAALFSRGADERAYPASLTKVMTALVALERMKSPEMRFAVPAEIFDELYAGSASLAGFEPGEVLTGYDLLAGTLLPSGGDASLTLAVGLAGSEAQFVAWMNEKAAALGLTGTHFTNVCGLHDPQHYSTARDMAALLDTALENETFRELFCLSRYTTPGTNKHPGGVAMRSTLTRGASTYLFSGGRLKGGKTGTTTPVGQCLVSLAEKNGREYILVTTGARVGAGETPSELLSVIDARELYGRIPEPAAAADENSTGGAGTNSITVGQEPVITSKGGTATGEMHTRSEEFSEQAERPAA